MSLPHLRLTACTLCVCTAARSTELRMRRSIDHHYNCGIKLTSARTKKKPSVTSRDRPALLQAPGVRGCVSANASKSVHGTQTALRTESATKHHGPPTNHPPTRARARIFSGARRHAPVRMTVCSPSGLGDALKPYSQAFCRTMASLDLNHTVNLNLRLHLPLPGTCAFPPSKFDDSQLRPGGF